MRFCIYSYCNYWPKNITDLFSKSNFTVTFRVNSMLETVLSIICFHRYPEICISNKSDRWANIDITRKEYYNI